MKKNVRERIKNEEERVKRVKKFEKVAFRLGYKNTSTFAFAEYFKRIDDEGHGFIIRPATHIQERYSMFMINILDASMSENYIEFKLDDVDKIKDFEKELMKIKQNKDNNQEENIVGDGERRRLQLQHAEHLENIASLIREGRAEVVSGLVNPIEDKGKPYKTKLEITILL